MIRKKSVENGGKNGHIGSSFNEFMKEEGLHEEASAIATMRVRRWRRTARNARAEPAKEAARFDGEDERE